MPTIPEIEEARANSRPLPITDVVYARMEFPLTARFSPLGFPLQMSSNSPAVLEAAAQSWGAFQELFQTPLLKSRSGSWKRGLPNVLRLRRSVFRSIFFPSLRTAKTTGSAT